MKYDMPNNLNDAGTKPAHRSNRLEPSCSSSEFIRFAFVCVDSRTAEVVNNFLQQFDAQPGASRCNEAQASATRCNQFSTQRHRIKTGCITVMMNNIEKLKLKFDQPQNLAIAGFRVHSPLSRIHSLNSQPKTLNQRTTYA